MVLITRHSTDTALFYRVGWMFKSIFFPTLCRPHVSEVKLLLVINRVVRRQHSMHYQIHIIPQHLYEMRTDGRMLLFMIYPLCKVSSLINDKLLSAKKISRKTFYIQLSSVVLTNNSTRYDKMKIHIFKNLLCNIWISCCFNHLLVLADTRRGF